MDKVPDDAVEDKEVLLPDHVHMDSVTQGLGCGCLQVKSPSFYMAEISFRTEFPDLVNPNKVVNMCIQHK